MMNSKRMTFATLWLALCWSCHTETPETGEQRNVILICLDTVRADHIGAYGYTLHATTPGLDALAADSTVFLDTSANACWTKPSVPSYMTGHYPIEHGVYEGHSKDSAGEHSDVLPESATTIAEVFQDAGYDTVAFVRNAQIRKGQGIEQGFDTYTDGAGDAKDIRWRALDYLDQRTGEEPFFMYLHLLDAHWPYPVPDEYGELFNPREAVAFFRTSEWQDLRDRINKGEVVLSEDQRQALIALYDGALRFIDDQLMLLFQGLEQRGLTDNTVICIISDHGEEFLEHGKIGHGHGLSEELLQVPWILHVPGSEGEVIETPVSLVDLFPTLLHAADLATDLECEGVDRLASPQLWRESFAEHKAGKRYEQSIRRGDLKLIRRMESLGGGRIEVPRVTAESLVQQGARLSVELDPDLSGGLRATRIKVRGDSDEPMEIKGVITELTKKEVVLAGVHVPLLEDVVLYGATKEADGESRVLSVGMSVKVKVRAMNDGIVGYRVKLYQDGADLPPEVRAVASSIVGEGSNRSLLFGALSVALDGQTVVDQGHAGGQSLSREELRDFLLMGEAGWQRFEDRLSFYDLKSDVESDSEAAPTEYSSMNEQLNEFGVRLARQPLWTSQDRKELTSQEIHELSAIGYGGGED